MLERPRESPRGGFGVVRWEVDRSRFGDAGVGGVGAGRKAVGDGAGTDTECVTGGGCGFFGGGGAGRYIVKLSRAEQTGRDAKRTDVYKLSSIGFGCCGVPPIGAGACPILSQTSPPPS